MRTCMSRGWGAKAKFARYWETLRTSGLVSPGDSFVKESLRRSLLRQFHPQLHTYGGAIMRFRKALAESIGPIWLRLNHHQNQSWGGADRLPLVGTAARQKNASGGHALLIVHDEFRTGYSSIGLLASRARLRFTGTARINSG